MVYIARNPKDCMVSYYYFYKMDQTLPDPETWDNFFSTFLKGSLAWGDWFDHVTGWWKARDEHKILYIFYEDMIEDSRRELCKVMRFLGKDFSEDVVKKILHHTSFKAMKANPMINFSVFSESIFDQSVSSFMRKGKQLEIIGQVRLTRPPKCRHPPSYCRDVRIPHMSMS
ncbi:hypothetical protein GDO78_016604 [Eleutherodactylus coqui]|nr:hypothetical protein GDO78_016604 [Eleutherodactylus coqui]